MHPNAAPVFVDDSGRRRALARRAGRLVMAGFVGYLGLLGAGFARDPHLGPVALPTFGVHASEPPATVLGEAKTRASGTPRYRTTSRLVVSLTVMTASIRGAIRGSQRLWTRSST